jgi:predicted secreted protein
MLKENRMRQFHGDLYRSQNEPELRTIGRFTPDKIRELCGPNARNLLALGCPERVYLQVLEKREAGAKNRVARLEKEERQKLLDRHAEIGRQIAAEPKSDAELVAIGARHAREMAEDAARTAEQERAEKLQKWQRGETQPWQQ